MLTHTGIGSFFSESQNPYCYLQGLIPYDSVLAHMDPWQLAVISFLNIFWTSRLVKCDAHISQGYIVIIYQ